MSTTTLHSQQYNVNDDDKAMIKPCLRVYFHLYILIACFDERKWNGSICYRGRSCVTVWSEGASVSQQTSPYFLQLSKDESISIYHIRASQQWEKVSQLD